ncbi:hypothetical protein GIB67_011801 [Kingdonia uniflora]|uniref:Uncharacterized protein n=1 Tax=Kingdonia uniflora TaxID=39325 RepID=A0A7J7NY88_9MAGN|nr:hypothetical protein GIB67_011801 [Kingdonia uniflora]
MDILKFPYEEGFDGVLSKWTVERTSATGKSNSYISRGHDVAEGMNASKCCNAIKQVSVSGFCEDVNRDDATGFILGSKTSFHLNMT